MHTVVASDHVGNYINDYDSHNYKAFIKLFNKYYFNLMILTLVIFSYFVTVKILRNCKWRLATISHLSPLQPHISSLELKA